MEGHVTWYSMFVLLHSCNFSIRDAARQAASPDQTPLSRQALACHVASLRLCHSSIDCVGKLILLELLCSRLQRIQISQLYQYTPPGYEPSQVYEQSYGETGGLISFTWCLGALLRAEIGPADAPMILPPGSGIRAMKTVPDLGPSPI